jgi:hypothetical protein
MSTVADLYVPYLRHPDPPSERFFDDGGAGGIAGNGPPQIVYVNGPPNLDPLHPELVDGTPYVDKLTGDIYWWYLGQGN